MGEEERFRAQLMANFAEDDRIEQLNDQKRRRKIQEHRKEVERLVKEKHQMYERERQQEIEEQERGKIEEARRHTIVEMERQRLLREHAGDLQNFFPKGSLSTSQTGCFSRRQPNITSHGRRWRILLSTFPVFHPIVVHSGVFLRFRATGMLHVQECMCMYECRHLGVPESCQIISVSIMPFI